MANEAYEKIPAIYGVSEAREEPRKIIAYTLVGAFVACILIILAYSMMAIDSKGFENGKELLSLVGSLFAGLVGAVVGFYFGSDVKGA